jgi:hypothetical protein
LGARPGGSWQRPGRPERGRQVGAAGPEPAENPGECEHREKRCGALQQVHDRERLGTDPGEEQSVNAALADRERRAGDEHQADDECDEPPLPPLDAEDLGEPHLGILAIVAILSGGAAWKARVKALSGPILHRLTEPHRPGDALKPKHIIAGEFAG